MRDVSKVPVRKFDGSEKNKVYVYIQIFYRQLSQSSSYYLPNLKINFSSGQSQNSNRKRKKKVI